MENNQINIEGIKLDEHVFEYSIVKIEKFTLSKPPS